MSVLITDQRIGGDKDNVSWNEAVRILNSGQVKGVFQTHRRNVILDLNSGTSISTTEPEIDDIFDEVEKCGERCKNVMLITE